MSDHPAGFVTVKGARFDIWTTDRGEWGARVSDTIIHQPTRDDLVKGIRREMAKAKVSVGIDFLTVSNGAVRHGTATGLHSRHGNVLVRWDNGDTDQLQRWDRDKTLLYSPENMVTWQRLRDEQLAANRALTAFEHQQEIKLGQVVKEALEAAVTAVQDGEE